VGDLAKMFPKGVKVGLEKGSLATLEMNHKVDPKAVNRAVHAMLNGLGLDRTDENLVETPRRVTKLWQDWLQPRRLEMKAFSGGGPMVTLVHHRSLSMCPHHMLPVEIIGSLAYIPQDWKVGLSKLARLIDFCGASLMLQENATEAIADLMDALLTPTGVMCQLIGRHGCMRLRGVKTNGPVVTTSLRGVFYTDSKARQEFSDAMHAGLVE